MAVRKTIKKDSAAGKSAKSGRIIKKVFKKEDKRKLNKLVTGFSFDLFIMTVILADAVVLGLMTSDVMELYFDRGLFLLDRLFMGIFIVEMFLKIYAQGRDFFKSGWNVFDLTVVAVSAVPAASALIILRTFRLFRLLKYIHHFSKMNNMVQVLIELLPTFVSFMAIFAVFFYVFAIIAVSLYGDIFASFSTLGQSMFTLLQVFTLDGWASTIARPVMLVFPHAWIFFVSVVVISFMIVVSFITAAVRQICASSK